MLFKKLNIILLASILFLFTQCQKADVVGLNPMENAAEKTNLITTSVDISTVAEDSIFTTNLAQTPFGWLNDATFGKTVSNLALSFNIPSTSYSFGTNPEIDSAVLVLKYGNEFYGDSTKASKLNIKVSELDTVFASESYSNKKTWKSGVLLKDTVVRNFAWGDTLRVYRIVTGGKDTLVKVAPQLRIKIAKENLGIIKDRLITKGNYNSSTAFRRASFKGVYISVDQASSTGTGGITFFDFQTSSNVSGLEIYYRSTNSSGGKDTTMAFFPTSSALAASNIVQEHATNIKNQLGNTNTAEVYVQPLAGLRAKIKFSELDKIRQLVTGSNGELKTVAINKATLIIPEVSSPKSSVFKPSPRLTLYRTDISGARKPVPDNAIGLDGRYLPEYLFGGLYQSTPSEYRFSITAYIQDLLTGRLKEYETYIAPIRKNYTGTYNIGASATTAARAILAGKANTASNKIRLEVIYTKPN